MQAKLQFERGARVTVDQVLSMALASVEREMPEGLEAEPDNRYFAPDKSGPDKAA